MILLNATECFSMMANESQLLVNYFHFLSLIIQIFCSVLYLLIIYFNFSCTIVFLLFFFCFKEISSYNTRYIFLENTKHRHLSVLKLSKKLTINLQVCYVWSGSQLFYIIFIENNDPTFH